MSEDVAAFNNVSDQAKQHNYSAARQEKQLKTVLQELINLNDVRHVIFGCN
jgi:hypothetical protein